MKYFAKYLPVNEPILKGDFFINYNRDESFLDITQSDVADFKDYADSDWTDNCSKVVLFLCTLNIKEEDNVFPFINGHCDKIELNPFHEDVYWDPRDFMSGWPDEPHVIKNMKHSNYKPYAISTSHGFGSPGSYVKVIGKISPNATFVNEKDMFINNQLAFRMQICNDAPFFQKFSDIKDFTAGIQMCKEGKWTIGVKCSQCNAYH